MAMNRLIKLLAVVVTIQIGWTSALRAQTTFTVNTTSDSNTSCDALSLGDCSLREAIAAANANVGADIIAFSIPGVAPFVITPGSLLDDITEPVVIDGTTQPLYAGSPLIEVQGGGLAHGFKISAGSSTVRGLIIREFGSGIWLLTTGSNLIESNFIGTNPAGDASMGNTDGILVQSASNTIGGVTAAARNVISANSIGIRFDGSPARSNIVAGNFIGTDAAGTSAVGNTGAGVRFENGARKNTIGGANPADLNLVSGNLDGIYLTGTTTDSNVIQGNYIGTDVNGTTALPNVQEGTEVRSARYTMFFGNVISGNGSNGIRLNNARYTDVQGNLIGTDVNGTSAVANGSPGVLIEASSKNSQIGGTTPAERNIISGNPSSGVFIVGNNTTSARIHGNYIGTDVTGTVALGNGAGIHVRGAPGVAVGGANPGEGNVISGNAVGLEIEQSLSTNTLVQGNFIGTDASGTAPVGNSTHGIQIHTNAQVSQIGGTSPGSGNLISGNAQHGVLIERPNQILEGNSIGVDINGGPLGNGLHGLVIDGSNNRIGGSAAAANTIAHNNGRGVVVVSGTGNLISANSIHSNGVLGIDLGANGSTVNDFQDPDLGANDLQNFPALSAAYFGSTIVEGAFNSTPNATFDIELFSSSVSVCAAGAGVGETFLTSVPVNTDANGDATIAYVHPTALPAGSCVTATATDGSNNTSELSPPVTVADFAVVVTPTAASVNRGGSTMLTVDVSPVSGVFNGNVTLSCPNAPAGTSCVFSKNPVVPGGSGDQAIVTVTTTDPTTPTGPHVLTVEGSSGATPVVHSNAATVTVEDFTVAAGPATTTVSVGDDAVYTITVSPDGGNFGDAVDLACDAATLPAGASCSFNPAQVTPNSTPQTSTLTINTTDGTTPVGTVSIDIDATSGSLAHATSASMTVTDYAVTLSPSTLKIPQGNAGTYTVTVAPLGGSFGEQVALSCDPASVPAGASCSFNPAAVTPDATSKTSTLTVSTTSPTTPKGTVTLSVEGKTVTLTRGGTASLEIIDPPSFTVTTDPTTASIVRGSDGTYEVTVTPDASGVNAAITLSCAGLPAGASCSFSNPDVTPGTSPATSTLTVSTTNPDTPAGSTDVTISGKTGAVESSATATLVVTDFDLAVSPGAPTTVRGSEATYTVTVAPNAAGGSFDVAVALSCSNLPAGATCTFEDASVTPGAADATTTLTVATTAPDTPTGSATFNVDGVAATLSRSVTADLDVTKDFTIAIDPGSQTVTAGQSGSYTVTVGQLGYFDDEVTLSCSNLPSNASCTFDQASVTPNDADVDIGLTIVTGSVASSGMAGGSLPKFAMWYVIPVVALPGMGLAAGASRRRQNQAPGRRRSRWTWGVAMLVLILVQGACGSEPVGPERTPETTTFTVTGSSGGVDRSATATIVVQ